MPLPPLPHDGSWLSRWPAAVRGAAVTGFLFASLFGFNLLQVGSLLLKPFSERRFRRLNRWAADSWWGLCAATTLRFHRTEVCFSGDRLPAGENALLIANHQTMTDIQALFVLAGREGRLGDLKWFVKDSIRFFPGVGWGMAFLDCLFVKRDWAADRSSIHRTFARLRQAQVPVWLIAFVEGTRLTAAKLERSQLYAQQQGLPFLRHLLLPRPRGFSASVIGLRDHLGAVYDITIGYVDGIPSLWQWAQGRMRRISLDVRRFPLDDLPSGFEDLKHWLLRRFQEKDRRLERFYREGFFGDSVTPSSGAGAAEGGGPARIAEAAETELRGDPQSAEAGRTEDQEG